MLRLISGSPAQPPRKEVLKLNRMIWIAFIVAMRLWFISTSAAEVGDGCLPG